MTQYTYTLGKHTQQAHDYTSALIDEAYNENTTHSQRVEQADKLCEAHYEQVGSYPSESVLSRLAWYIVFDEMTDSHPDKMSREEYPMLSRGQMERRDEKTTLLDDLQYGDLRGLGKRKVNSSMVTDDGENADDSRPFVNSIRLIGQRRTEADDVNDRLSFAEMIDGANLTVRERHVIVEMFANDRNQFEVAADMDVSQARISQLLNRALDKIRDSLGGNTA